MGHHPATGLRLDPCRPARMIVVTVREQEVFDVRRCDAAGADILEKGIYGAAATRIHQGRATFNSDQINRRVLHGSEPAAAHLEYFVGYSHRAPGATRRF